MDKESAMEDTLKEVAKDNMAFELDEQHKVVEAGRAAGVQFPDNPQNGAYVIPISQNEPKDTIASGTLTGRYAFYVVVACENKSYNIKNSVIKLQPKY